MLRFARESSQYDRLVAPAELDRGMGTFFCSSIRGSSAAHTNRSNEVLKTSTSCTSHLNCGGFRGIITWRKQLAFTHPSHAASCFGVPRRVRRSLEWCRVSISRRCGCKSENGLNHGKTAHCDRMLHPFDEYFPVSTAQARPGEPVTDPLRVSIQHRQMQQTA